MLELVRTAKSVIILFFIYICLNFVLKTYMHTNFSIEAKKVAQVAYTFAKQNIN